MHKLRHLRGLYTVYKKKWNHQTNQSVAVASCLKEMQYLVLVFKSKSKHTKILTQILMHCNEYHYHKHSAVTHNPLWLSTIKMFLFTIKEDHYNEHFLWIP